VCLHRTFWFIKSLLPADYIDGLADAVQQGLVKAVGVSNYNGTPYVPDHFKFPTTSLNFVHKHEDDVLMVCIAVGKFYSLLLCYKICFFGSNVSSNFPLFWFWRISACLVLVVIRKKPWVLVDK
jgi:hypothetical protein